MKPVDLILILVIAFIIGGASYYVYRAKKSGKKCIGCPYCSKCGGHCTSCSSVSDTEKEQSEK